MQMVAGCATGSARRTSAQPFLLLGASFDASPSGWIGLSLSQGTIVASCPGGFKADGLPREGVPSVNDAYGASDTPLSVTFKAASDGST
jgi:hypothetical protein